MLERDRVSVCIANYKQDKFLREAIDSINMQTYKNLEIVIFHDDEGVGSGEAFNRAIAEAKGDIIILLCADDVFTNENVIDDIVKVFETSLEVVHVSRWYHQFVDGDRSPVRAWRGNNVIELANNPSGLAFRRALMPRLSNKMFVEAPEAVWRITSGYLANIFHSYSILKYDTVAVRVHKSTARSKEYYRKMWNSSPVLEWAKLGWISNDFTSLIQIKNYFSTKAMLEESWNFVKVNPNNLLNPALWFFTLVALVTPRFILLIVPDIYRATWGIWTTKECKREK